MNRLPGFLQLEQVTTAEGVDVTTIAYSTPFAFREGPSYIALFAYILRIVITARSSVKSPSASALYLQMFILESFQHYVQYAVIVEYLSHVRQFIP